MNAFIVSSDYRVDGCYLRVQIDPFAEVFLPLVDVAAKHNEELHQTIAAVLAFAWATGLQSERVTIYTRFPVPILFSELVREYGLLSGRELIFSGPQHSTPLRIDGARGGRNVEETPVLLFSGGKDSLAQLYRLRNRGVTPHVLYIRGLIINKEFPRETENILTLSAELGISPLFLDVHCDFARIQWPATGPFRCTWREFLLLCLARTLGSHIYTGINEDALFSLRHMRSRTQAPSSESKYVARFFTLTELATKDFSRLIRATVFRSGAEIENLKVLRDAGIPYSRSKSCYNSGPTCEGSFVDLCPKCKAITIYTKVLDGQSLSPEEVTHIRGPEWVGDDDLPSYIEENFPGRESCRTITYENITSWINRMREGVLTAGAARRKCQTVRKMDAPWRR